MFRILALFWPFVVDTFFGQRTESRGPSNSWSIFKLLIALLFIGGLLLVLYQAIGGIFFETHQRYLEVSQRFLDLEKEHQELTTKRDEIYRQLNDLQNEHKLLEKDRERLMESGCGCGPKLIQLKQDLDNCRIMLPDEAKSDVRDLLKTID